MEVATKWVVGGILSLFSYLLGGLDTLLETLLLMICLDMLTGWISAAYLGRLSSKISFRGILKKVLMLTVVVVCHRLDQLGLEDVIQAILGFPVEHPCRTLCIWFFLGNEGLSLVENVGKVIPLPKWLTKLFETLKDRGEGGK